MHIRNSLIMSPVRRGAAAVELAVLLPLIAFLLLIATDFSRVFYYSIIVTNCARNGALYASDPTTATQTPYTSIEQAALADAPNVSGATVTSSTGSSSSGGGYVDVTVKYTFHTITSFPGIPNTVELTRTVRMRQVAVVPNFG